MIAFLLILLMSVPGTWHWDASLGATGYEFCWSYGKDQWNRALCTDVGLNLSFMPSVELEEQVWIVQPGSVLFFQVCAYNEAGYDAACADFAPIPPDWDCPNCTP